VVYVAPAASGGICLMSGRCHQAEQPGRRGCLCLGRRAGVCRER